MTITQGLVFSFNFTTLIQPKIRIKIYLYAFTVDMLKNIKKWGLTLNRRSEVPVFKQIQESIGQGIGSGKLVPGDQLPSIHKLAGEFGLSAGTIVRAFEELRELGIITSRQGKGYFIASVDIALRYRVFLLFDRITAFKEILYDSFRSEFDDQTDIHVFFHHYNAKRFEKLIRENQGKYSHYVLMPHLSEDIRRFLNQMPEKKTVFIDNFPEHLNSNAGAVYQDFHRDIYQALLSKIGKVREYRAVRLSLSQSDFQFVPAGTQAGFRAFCEDHQLTHSIIRNITPENLQKHELFIVFDDLELVQTLKLMNERGWKPVRDIGIISFDDHPVKEMIAGGISVLSTDFVRMGKTAAGLVKGTIKGQIANPFQLIDRNSF